MVDLLITEILKMKRSKMLRVSLAGAAVAPLMVCVAYCSARSRYPEKTVGFETLFSETGMFMVLLIGTMLYGVITAYLFHREFGEGTLKNLLTIPISRTRFLLSKFILLLLWILMLTAAAWILTILLGLLAGFRGFTLSLALQYLGHYLAGGALLFALSPPVVLVTLVFRDYVPTIVFTIIITMVNVMIINSEYIALFPWSAAYVIVKGAFVPEFPPLYSYMAILITAVIGAAGTQLYFSRVDIK